VRRSLFPVQSILPRMLMILLILSLGFGSSAAALACTDMPLVKSAGPMSPGCPDQPKAGKNDQAAACALMCAATPAPSNPLTRRPLVVSINIVQPSHAVLPWTTRPEPPPPRNG
jgi:hypothetical protein